MAFKNVQSQVTNMKLQIENIYVLVCELIGFEYRILPTRHFLGYTFFTQFTQKNGGESALLWKKNFPVACEVAHSNLA